MAESPLPVRVPASLDIGGQLQKRGWADVDSVTVSRLPAGSSLSAGADNGDGTWTLATADLDGLTLIPPPDVWGRTSIAVTVVVTDLTTAAREPVTTAFGVVVDFGPSPVPPAAVEQLPPAEPDAAPIPDDVPPIDGAQTIALDIDMGLPVDAPGPISVTIGGVPAGATLSAGVDMGDGVWALDSADLPGLTMTLSADATAEVALDVAATAADGAHTAGVLTVPLNADADAEPEPEPVPEPEPEFIAEAEPEAEPEPEPEPEPEFIAEPEPAAEPEPEFIAEAEPAAEPEPEFIAEAEQPAEDETLDETIMPRQAGAGLAPIAYWKLDETQPGTVVDEMGSRPGSSRGADPAGGGGPFDAVDVFDGIDDYIEVPDAADLAIAGGALTVWFDAFASGQGTLISKGLREGDYLALSIRGRRLQFTVRSGGGACVVAGGRFAANEWNQTTVAWGADGVRLFLNGDKVGAEGFDGGLAGIDGPWIFGAAKTESGNADFFHGELDDIAIYAVPLRDDDVLSLFQVGVIGVMEGEAEVGVEPPAGDSPIDLDAVRPETEGPESLATIDAEEDDEGDDGDDEKDLAAVEAELAESFEAEPEPALPPEIEPAPTPEALATGDSPIDLDAVRPETEGPESLATIDAEEDEEDEEDDEGDEGDDDEKDLAAAEAELAASFEAEPAPALPPEIEPAPTPEALAAGDSPIDLDAVRPETEGPENLATIDAERKRKPENKAVDGVGGAGGEVFVFAAGAAGDFFQHGRGWADAASAVADQAPSGGDGSITLGPEGEIKIEGGDKIEW